MAQKLNLGLKQSQNLMMTPQLQQAIKLLTLTHLEMTNVIAQEMVENPMLEETGGESSRLELDRERGPQETTAENFSGPEIIEGGKDNFDWDKYVESYNNTSSSPATKERLTKDDAPNYENMVSKGQSLQDHLEWQLRMENLTEEEWRFSESVIYNINDDGYLSLDLEVLLGQTKLDREDALELVKMIQNLDPVGCATSSLAECLLVQAKALEVSVPLVELIIKKHLDDLLQKNYSEISQSLGVDDEQIRTAELVIHSFHPKPGRLQNSDEIQYVVPDIYIKEVGGELIVQLNDDGVPKLKVSKLYQDLIKNQSNRETSDYVQDKLRDALFLIKSIENRQKTIEKVAHAIVKYQPDFFKKGAEYLRPMILKDIANEIDVHESTVSRVTTNKFVHTPLGVFELKFFFNAGIGGKNGGIDIASESLKIKIKELVGREDPKRPLSDQKIVELLGQHDIQVARRTVAKYREMLNILPSAKRKIKK